MHNSTITLWMKMHNSLVSPETVLPPINFMFNGIR